MVNQICQGVFENFLNNRNFYAVFTDFDNLM